MFIIPIYILCIFSSVVIYFVFSKYFENKSPIRLAVVNFIFVYMVFVLGMYGYDFYLDLKLQSFDLNGDGFFTDQEVTSEQEKYMSLVTGDVGRTFAPITGLLFSFVYSVIYFGLIKLYNLFRRNQKRK